MVRPPKRLAEDEIAINEPIAKELGLKVGDTVTLRFSKLSQVPADSPLGRKTDRVQALPEVKIAAILPDEGKSLTKSLITLKPMNYIRSWTQYKNGRGMNRWRDIVDWVGGYPYEVATVDEIFEFYKARGFMLTKLKSGGVGLGCNEFVFERI